MGFFDTIKNSAVFDTVKGAAIKAKCTTGFHAGKFEPIDGMPNCNIGKTCPDCGKYVKEIKHNFGKEKYVNLYTCEVSKSCIHCEESVTREQHEGFQVIAVDDYCRPKEQCKRCRQERIGKPKHSWTKSPLSSPTENTVEWYCTTCNAREMRDKTSF